MTALLYCNTLFQLVCAVQISKKKEFDSYILVLSDKIPERERLVTRIQQHSNNFKIVTSFSLNKKTSRLMLLIYSIFGFANKKLSNERVDVIIAFNMDYETHCLFSFFSRHNKKLFASQMEEGVLSYNTIIKHSKLIRFSNAIRRILLKPVLLTSINKFYAFSPDFYKGKMQVDYIPKIDPNNIDDVLIYNYIFDKKSDYHVKEKYVYIPSVYDFDGDEPIGEFDLAIELSNSIGIDNLLVKPHPRDRIDRFLNKGFKVNTDTIPLELFWLFYCSQNNIMVSTLSSAILNIKNIFLKTPKMYYVFNLCNYSKNSLAIFYASCIQKNINCGFFPKTYITTRIEDLKE